MEISWFSSWYKGLFDSKYLNMITHTKNLGLDSIEYYYTAVMKFGNLVLLPTTWIVLRNNKKELINRFAAVGD